MKSCAVAMLSLLLSLTDTHIHSHICAMSPLVDFPLSGVSLSLSTEPTHAAERWQQHTDVCVTASLSPFASFWLLQQTSCTLQVFISMHSYDCILHFSFGICFSVRFCKADNGWTTYPSGRVQKMKNILGHCLVITYWIHHFKTVQYVQYADELDQLMKTLILLMQFQKLYCFARSLTSSLLFSVHQNELNITKSTIQVTSCKVCLSYEHCIPQ